MKPFFKRALIALLYASTISAMEPQKQANLLTLDDLDYARETYFIECLQDGDINLINEFLEEDKGLAGKEIDGMIPLYYTLLFGHVESAKMLCDLWPLGLLLKNSETRKSALSFAASKELYDFIGYVFENHRAIFTDDVLSRFILKRGHVDMIKCIFSPKGHKLNIDDFFVKKIVDLASFSLHVDVVKYLIDYDPSFKEHILKKYMDIHDYDMTHIDEEWSLENLEKQDFACLSLVNHMKEFCLNEKHEAIQYSRFSIEFSQKYNKNRYWLSSNHRSLINYRGWGNQGAGVKVIVWDSFLTPPQDSRQILYSSRMDHKVPLDVRKCISEKGVIERNIDDGTHGIQVAGLIADNDFGIAPKAQIIPVFKDGIIFQDPKKITGYILRENYGAKIINMSFGDEDNIRIDSIYIPVLKILCQTHIVVKSAGNDGRSISKGFHKAVEEDEFLRKHLFVVADVMPDGKTLSDASCYFSEPNFPDVLVESIGIAAPGTDIISTIAEHSIQQFGIGSGTSLAAAIVSGAIAKLMSDFPDFSLTEIADLVRAGANKEGVFADRGKYGQGFLDLERTYKLAREYVMDREVIPEAFLIAYGPFPDLRPYRHFEE